MSCRSTCPPTRTTPTLRRRCKLTKSLCSLLPCRSRLEPSQSVRTMLHVAEGTSMHASCSRRRGEALKRLHSPLAPTGVIQDGALHLVPLTGAMQLRPSLAHIDAADEANKEAAGARSHQLRPSEPDAADAAARLVCKLWPAQLRLPCAGKSKGAYDDDMDEDTAEPPTLQPLQVQVRESKAASQAGATASRPAARAPPHRAPSPEPPPQVRRRETEKQAEARLTSHAFLKKREARYLSSSLVRASRMVPPRAPRPPHAFSHPPWPSPRTRRRGSP